MPSDPTALLLTWMGPLLAGFTAPTARHALVLVTGALLTPSRRTVAAALRAAGYGQAADFTSYHRVLNRNRWSPRQVAQRLLRLLVHAFTPEGPVVIGLDDTLERRWGAKIKARGIYRDPVRSSHGQLPPSALPWRARQSERVALALGHAAAADPLDRASLGAAIPHRARALRAVRAATPAPP